VSTDRKKLLRTALLGSTATLAGGAALTAGGDAFAQGAQGEEQVFVTGSRIPRQDLVANSPVAVVGAEEIALTGNVQVENLLNDLPQVVPGLTSVNNNPGGIGSTVDLRGIGVNRTLVLVNGRRWLPAGLAGFTDIQTIPTGMIERIEVMTGGASATYGSDAIAGVINFILKDDFEGLTANAQYDIFSHGDGERIYVDATMGSNFADGRGNVMINVSWFKQNPIFQGDRAFSQAPCITAATFFGTTSATVTTSPIPGSEGALCGWFDPSGPNHNNLVAFGSSRQPQGRIIGGRFTSAGAATSTLVFNNNGTFAGSPNPSTCPTAELTGGGPICSYNYAPPNYLQLPVTRTTMNLTGHYDINDDIQFFMEASFVNIDYGTRLAPVPATTRVNLNTTNPFFNGITAGDGSNAAGTQIVDLVNALANAACTRFKDPQGTSGSPGFSCGTFTGTAPGSTFVPFQGTDAREWIRNNNNGNMPFRVSKRMIEVGARANPQDRDLYQFTVGFRGAFANGWNWETFYQYAKFRWTNSVRNDVQSNRFKQALDIRRDRDGGGNPINGTTHCNIPAGQDPFATAASGPCVPMNFFGLNSITPDVVHYIKTDAVKETEFEREMFGFNLNGTVVELPAGPLGFAVGVEGRRESGRFAPDDTFAQGTTLGFNATNPTVGRINVWEVYGETLVPLISDTTLIKYLAIEGGFRWSKYSTVGTVFTWKLGGEYRPFDDLKIRGLFQRAVRAPNISELFAGTAQGFPGYTDPCNGTNVAKVGGNAATACTIWTNGVWSAGFVQQDSQVQAAFLSNPNLIEETSNTWSVGGVFTPHQIPNLELIVDYYSITLKNGIALQFGGTSSVIAGCFAALLANPVAATLSTNTQCSRSPRAAASGQLGTQDPVVNIVGNLSKIFTRGIDITVRYNFDLEDAIGVPGTITFEGLYTHVFTSSIQALPGGSTTDCAGFYACGGITGFGAVPDNKVAARATYRNGAYAVSFRWTMIGNLSNPYGQYYGSSGNPYFIVQDTGARHVLDFTFSWDINDTVSLILGVDNILNSKPPFLGLNFGIEDNTDPSTFNSQLLGPRLFARVTLNL
jgi:iron complex outermembrane recepter protein